ncbi:septum formation family protein [Nocardioides sp.]|uniref:septum formation family protein n=1 Tax=Nocardioides sp. TaxID=35761 RepID=UPI0035697104
MSSRRTVLGLVVAALLLTGCGDESQGTDVDPAQLDAVSPPEVGDCRVLAPEDTEVMSNATATVDCRTPHTAETYLVEELPPELGDADREDPEVNTWIHEHCQASFISFLGADESLAMRTIVSWSAFRPSAKAWDEGARWYRCDVVGGAEQSKEYVELPVTAQGLMKGKPDDRWLVCVKGPSVQDAPRIPCSEPHDWRAVTTVKLGEADDPYPGDRQSQIQTRDFCSDSVGGWLSYPVTYDYGYTWFTEEEWEAGNRRSVCWARTDA